MEKLSVGVCIVPRMTKPFRIGSYYTRDEIGARFGGTKQWYLPTVDSKVVAVCLRKEHNPKAPNVVLCGSGPKIAKTGEWLAAATWTLPVFVKEAENRWQYCGRYKVASSCTSGPIFKREIAGHENPGSITRVVFLKRAFK